MLKINKFYNVYRDQTKDYVIFGFRNDDGGLNEVKMYNPRLYAYIGVTLNGLNLSNVMSELFNTNNEQT